MSQGYDHLLWRHTEANCNSSAEAGHSHLVDKMPASKTLRLGLIQFLTGMGGDGGGAGYRAHLGAGPRPRWEAMPLPPMIAVMWPRAGGPRPLLAPPLAGPPRRGACCMGVGPACTCEACRCWDGARGSGASPFSSRTGSSNADAAECSSACSMSNCHNRSK